MVEGRIDYAATLTQLVSIIVPTLDSERTLGWCLQSIRGQTYPNIEMIVVDRFSKDQTLRIAKEFGARIILGGPERSAQKNQGAICADGSFVLFVDSDMELSPNVVRECVDVCSGNRADASIVPQVSIARGFLSECRKMERDSYIGNDLFEAPRFFEKSIFLATGGYDEKIVYMEDTDLCLRLKRKGYKIRRIQAKIFHHEGELSMETIVRKAYYYGKNLPLSIEKNRELVLKRAVPTNSAYIRNIKTLAKHPVHLVGIMCMKFFEYSGYSLGLLSCYI